MKKYGIVCIFCMCMFFSIAAQNKNTFSWKFAFYDENGSIINTTNSTNAVSMSDGQKFRFWLQPESDAYCYVADEQADGNVSILYSKIIKRQNAVNLPAPDQFFVLEPPDGIERFYIIVSAVRQKKLEKSFSAGDSQQILDEIGRLRLAQTPFAEIPVKPAVMGAAARGLADDSFATGCSGASIYVRTIKIKH
ncbi:MAG: DUF4384 domain-containing protein [Treponema sp.]|nr:DUF4384 domain-containing protein [Treponema sp.]